MTTPGFRDYLRRFQIFVPFYIEGGEYIDEEDDRWEFVVLCVVPRLSLPIVTDAQLRAGDKGQRVARLSLCWLHRSLPVPLLASFDAYAAGVRDVVLSLACPPSSSTDNSSSFLRIRAQDTAVRFTSRL